MTDHTQSLRRTPTPYRLALAAATFVAAAVASHAQTALPVLTRELYLQSTNTGSPLIQISAPPTLSPAYNMILPPSPGNTGDVLTWNTVAGGLIWQNPSAGSWSLLGNTIATAGTGVNEVFLGTRNDQPLILATINTVTPQSIRLFTGNTERMRILGTGEVGIGTPTPGTQLDVTGTFRATGNSTIGGTLTLSSVGAGVSTEDVLLISAANQVTRTTRDALIASIGWALSGNAGTTALQYVGTSDAQPLSIRTNGAERIRILSSGEVGIGVALPTATLHVGGNIIASANSSFLGGVTVNTSGSAISALTVRQANALHTDPYIGVETSTGSPVFTIGGDQSMYAAGNVTLNSLNGVAGTVVPAGFDRIVIGDATGRLEEASINAVVSEGIQANAWSIRGNNATTDAGTLGAAPLAGGNFIGTTVPVSVSLVTDNRIRAQISSLGDMAVQLDMRVSGLTVGKGGGGQTTNTALGASALIANTVGVRNTGVGAEALFKVAFGNSNTALGKSALSENFTGSNNTAVGSEALYSLVAADNNVAMGTNALYTLEGNGNTAIGTNAMRYAAIGNGNVALGAEAGVLISGGTDLLSATNSIFIGANARANASGESNQIVIGQGAVGIGTNSVVIGNNTTESTRLRGRLGVGANPTGGVGDAQVQITPADAANIGLTVRGAVGQTGNLLELRNSAGGTQFSVGPTGATTIAGTLTLLSTAAGTGPEDVLLINATNQVMRTTRAALFAGNGWALIGNANTTAANYIGTSDVRPLSIRTNATERIRIDENGLVGVGVSTPLTRLHVSDGVLTEDDSYASYDANAVLIVHKTPTSDADLNDPLPLLYLAREGTAGEAFAAGVEMSLSRYEDVADNSRTRFDIALANSNFLGGKNTVMTMRSAGFVGINNTTPTQALDVTGTFRATGLITGNAGATISGAVTSINANSNFATSINTGTSTGTVSIGNSLSTTAIAGATGITGTTSINTTGNASTTIGNASTTGTTTIATNGATGRLAVTGLLAVDNTNTDNVMLVDAATGNVSSTSRADLFAGSGWALNGNDYAASSGALGAAPVGTFLGSRSTSTAKDVRIAANGLTRIVIDGTTGLTSIGSIDAAGTVTINSTGAGTTSIGTGATAGTVAIGRTGGTITTIGAIGHTGTLTSSGLITGSAGVNLSGASSPLQVGGSAGTNGQVLVSAGAGTTPTWVDAQTAVGIKSKGRSALLTSQSTFVITGLTNVDNDDGVSIVLESDDANMDIPPYFIRRVASPTAGSITVRFSAPFTGYVTWVVVD